MQVWLGLKDMNLKAGSASTSNLRLQSCPYNFESHLIFTTAFEYTSSCFWSHGAFSLEYRKKTNTEEKREPISRIPELCYQMKNMSGCTRLYKIHSEPADLPWSWLSYEYMHQQRPLAFYFPCCEFLLCISQSCEPAFLLYLPNKQPLKFLLCPRNCINSYELHTPFSSEITMENTVQFVPEAIRVQ